MNEAKSISVRVMQFWVNSLFYTILVKVNSFAYNLLAESA